MTSRRGEAVPILILAIAILLVIYTYFLPLSEKCKLIPSLPDCKAEEKTLVFETVPGILEKQETAARYWIPDVQLFRRETVDVSSALENAEASKSWLFSKPAEAEIEAQRYGREAKLFIFINDAEGKLNVYLDNELIGVVEGEGVQQLVLDPKRLRETNMLKVVPTAPIWPFMSNKYTIGKVILKENYILTNNRISAPFAIKENSKDIRDIRLSFETRCFTDENVGVFIGNDKVFDEKVCQGVSTDVTDKLLKNNLTGNITFSSDGNYDIHDIMFDIRMKERTWPTYYFNIGESDKPLLLKMQFNETGMKKLTAYVNGEAISVETSKKEWQTAINKYIKEGTNSLLLIPEETVIVGKLEVE